ncbi:MAG: NAD(+)/NADH kinase [Acidobacteria bacterium]|nr:NAD(+)/NADH kinase [Acidobacteriota bacterium]
MRTVGIISKPRKENIAAVVPRLLEWLRAHNLEVFYDQETAECIAPGGPIRQAQGKPEVPREELAARTDMIILLGGDGTLLAAARMMGDSAVPILPVNLGGLGFLTSVTLEELYSVLEEVLAGNHRISERVLLEAEVLRNGQVIERQRALNDAVLNKAALARIIDLELLIDGGYVCSYKADGLIVSTPTGSTAYSLAAGGPIVYPVLDAFIITPICPHSLTNRPLVVPDTMSIEIDFRCGDESVFLTIDGQVGIELKEGDRVAIRKAPTKLRVVRPVKKTYFHILRNKLKWGGR